jgi:hypothetical protein
MKTSCCSFTDLSDAELLAKVKRLAEGERHATAQLIASLAELDARRLYLGEGCSSLFTYCTQVLHLSEHAAYGRIEAARATRRFPTILDRLADGSITLTVIGLLAPHLTPENHGQLLDAAKHRSKRDVELLVTSLHPQPDVPSSVRKLPSAVRAVLAPPPTRSGRTLSDSVSAPASLLAPVPFAEPTNRPTVVAPLAPERYKVQVTVGAETVDKLRRVQDLLRHVVPDGDAAVILDRALTMLLEHLERTKLAATATPRLSRPLASGSRHIPAAVRRAVWARDEGRCAFVGTRGRCTERGFLEFHHIVPYAAGGETTVDTIALRCKAHNLHEAEQDFGVRVTEHQADSVVSGP